MAVVAIFVVLGAALVLMGLWGRCNAGSLGHVRGMPDDVLEHRVTVLRRGASACVAVGIVFVGLGIAAPFL
jgi:hypothetical protein